ncbi:MAG TPA: efflux RND transporter permease subunit [Caldithrix abyssi]|uniref:Efflux RND transporter permease subunit n=1 Tax=Caldithrix abyssi TaxID=187145 RepID=A0A7V4U0H1_CALAY|nr:efflux RND transporter permease subunit [Caldithrix abyssi]
MKLTEVSIKNSVGTALITIMLVVLGGYALVGIPVSFWPEFVAPTLIVIAPYPGVGPEEIEERIAKPLEEELSTIDGLDELETTCSDGLCKIAARFDWGMDFDETKIKVQEQTNKARSRFPRQALEPKVLQVQDFIPPGIELAFTSEKRSLGEVRDFIENKIKNRFLRLSEVATTQIKGGYESHIAVKVLPEKLYAYGLTLGQIAGRIAAENKDVSAGKIETDFKNRFVRIQGRYRDVEQLGEMTIAIVNGAAIRLKDVARVTFEPKEKLSVTHLNGKEIVGLAIREKNGGNTVAMCNQVKDELERVRKILPADIQVRIIRDQSLFIVSAIRTVVQNAFIGSLLAAVIILLFFGSLRNTLIIALSIPISIITTFILVSALGLSINTISLGGLALGVGMIVDSSIVVIENIFRHMQQNKKDRLNTIIEATQEVGLAISSSTLTSIVVFLPLAFLVGLAAVLLGELALTVVFALSISVVVALTVVPALSHKLMVVHEKATGIRKIFSFWQKWFEKITAGYKPVLRFCLRHRLLILFGALLIFAASIVLIVPQLDMELLPSINEGEFNVDLELPAGTRLDITRQTAEQVEEYLLKQKEIEQTYTTIGQSPIIGETKSNMASVIVRVKKVYVAEIKNIMERVRNYCNTLPAVQTVVKQVTSTAGMKTEPVNVRLGGSDLQVLEEIGQRAVKAISAIPGVVNLKSTIQQGLPEYQFKIDRIKADQLGIDYNDIITGLRQSLLGSAVSRFSAYGEEYDITLKVADTHLRTINDLLALPVRSRRGFTVPLSTVAHAELGQAPAQIKRYDQVRVVEIKADVQGRSRRAVLDEVHQKMDQLHLPSDYFITYGGMSRGIRDSFTSLANALMIAIFLVYVVMGTQFNSFIHPFTIAFSIPLAIIGVLGGLWLFGSAISTNAFLGSIMLVGIVVNNGILLIDFIRQLRRRGLEKEEAIVEGAATRLRPVVITSLTTIFGMLPIAFGFGEGGEALRPLGAVVVGGLATSTFLTLFIVPVVYSLMDRLTRSH